MIIDRKFKILAINPCSGKHYTERDGVFFCAKDLAFLTGALPAYRQKCIDLKCGSEHIESVDLLMERIVLYQQQIECKIPDTDRLCEIDRCIGGKL